MRLYERLSQRGPLVALREKGPRDETDLQRLESGKGSVYEFDEFEGNKNVGKRRLEIVEAVPPSRVVLTLDMIKPMQGRNIVEYTLERKGDSTNVTWAMHGQNSYAGKIACIFINMDRMVGRDFEAFCRRPDSRSMIRDCCCSYRHIGASTP